MKFEKYNLPPLLSDCKKDFEEFYYKHQKTHKLMWVFSLGTVDIRYLYLKKPYQSTSTAIQYSILLLLEKSDIENKQLTIEEVTAKLAYNPKLITNEVLGFIFNPSFNPKKDIKTGLVTTDASKEADINLKTKIWLNKDFQVNPMKLSTIPPVIKVRELLITIYNNKHLILIIILFILITTESSFSRRRTKQDGCTKS